jgi:glycosyltransferase involved in cell wall biosynthesis
MSRKIVHWIFPNLNTVGGRSNYVNFLIHEFSKLEIENHVITTMFSETNHNSFLNYHKVFFHNFDFNKAMEDIHSSETMRQVKELNSLFLTENFDVLLIHSLKPESFIYLKLLLNLVNPKLKIILLIHDLETIKYLAIDRNLDLFVLKESIFICPSRYIQNELNGIMDNGGNIIYLPHGVIALPKVENLRSNRRDFTFVGDFEVHKGIVQLVIAWARIFKSYPDSKLFLIGDGKLINFVKRLVVNLGIESKVVFTGWLNKDDLGVELASKRFLVIPSLIGESFSLIAAEVQSLGLPAVTSNNGALIEIISNSTNGILVSPGNIDELERALILLLKDNQLVDKLSVGAYEKSKYILRPKEVINRYLRILF